MAEAKKPRKKRKTEITKWRPNKTARRVPTFVREMTGLDTKLEILKVYPKSAVFVKGQPLPEKLPATVH